MTHEEKLEDRLYSIIVWYDRLKDDPRARIPTILTLSIEAARKYMQEREDTINGYANAAIKRDKEPPMSLDGAIGSRGEIGISPRGGTLKAGT